MAFMQWKRDAMMMVYESDMQMSKRRSKNGICLVSCSEWQVMRWNCLDSFARNFND